MKIIKLIFPKKNKIQKKKYILLIFLAKKEKHLEYINLLNTIIPANSRFLMEAMNLNSLEK